MTWVRLCVSGRGRTELHERAGPNVMVGSGEGATLRIVDHTLADQHAEILIRRGRAIISDTGRSKTGITKDGDRLRAPVALTPDTTVSLGDFLLSATVIERDERGWVGDVFDGARVAFEIAPLDVGVRRYQLDDHRELSVPAEGAPWCESLVEGIRLSGMLGAVQQNVLQLPAEAAIALAAQVAEGTRRYWADHGVHGALEPRRIHLGVDGSLTPLIVGAKIDLSEPSLEPFLAPERRYGLPPSKAADSFGVGRLVQHLALGPSLVDTVAPLLVPTPPDRSADLGAFLDRLLETSHKFGLDPTYLHAARAVRLIVGRLGRPLVEIPRARADQFV